MYRYQRYIVLLISTLFFASCSQNSVNLEVSKNEQNANVERNYKKVETKELFMEELFSYDAYILESEQKYEEANKLLLKLFYSTNRYSYLVNYLKNSLILKNHKDIIEKTQKYFIFDIKEEESILRYYSFALMLEKDYENSLQAALILIKKYKNQQNYELLGNIYLLKDDFINSYNSYLKAITYENSVASIHALSGMEFYKFDRKEDAIFRLESSFKETNYNYSLFLQAEMFFNILKETKRADTLIKEVYDFYSDNMFYLEKNALLNFIFSKFQNLEQTIDYFNKIGIEDEILVELYIKANRQKEALELVERVLKREKNINLIAQKATLLYEVSLEEDSLDETKINSIISMLEDVLKQTQKAYYLNYLSYLLIDHDIDYNRGIDLVRKALIEEPDNLAFIDTLSWGLYKVGECTEAFGFMEYVVNKVGIEDEEIKEHYEKIKECISDDIR